MTNSVVAGAITIKLWGRRARRDAQWAKSRGFQDALLYLAGVVLWLVVRTVEIVMVGAFRAVDGYAGGAHG